jgi:serine/threonine-protein kinase
MPDLDATLLARLELIAKQYTGSRKGYSFENHIDSGGSAAVYKINTPDGCRALKVCNPDLLRGDSGKAEANRIALQTRLIGKPCSNMVETYAVEIDETCIIEMEYLPWNSLKKSLKEIPEENIHSLILQLIAAVKHLEILGLVHRDIKPENILISQDFKQLKLIDFGVVRDISSFDDQLDLTDHGHKKPFLATAQYSSPEYLFRLVEPSEALWKGLTIYQVGAVLHDLLTKTPIFYDEVQSANRFVLAMAVLRKIPSLDSATNPNLIKLKRLSSSCLTKNLQARLVLIDWKYFDLEDESPLKKLKSRLAQKKNLANLDDGEQILNRQETELNKHKTLVAIYESTKTTLIQEIGSYVKLEGLSPNENAKQFELKICLSNGIPGLEVKLSFEWGLEDEIGSAIVNIQTRKADAENISLWDGSPKVIGTANFAGINQNELVINICEHIAGIIEISI